MKRPWITFWLLFSASFIHWLNFKSNFTNYELPNENGELKIEPEMTFGDISRNLFNNKLTILNVFGFLNILVLIIYRFSMVRKKSEIMRQKISIKNFRNHPNVKCRFLLLVDFEKSTTNVENNYFV